MLVLACKYQYRTKITHLKSGETMWIKVDQPTKDGYTLVVEDDPFNFKVERENAKPKSLIQKRV